ncbi:MAG: Snf7 family protein [Candidatus Helarchaeota archaeon]
MSFIRKLFPKKQVQKRDQIIAQIRQSMNQMNLRSRKFASQADQNRLKARKYIKSNKALAKQYLARYQKSLKLQKRYDTYIAKLEDRIFALEQAEDIKAMTEAMKGATVALKQAAVLINPQTAMELSVESQQAMADIDRAGEIFAEEEDLDLDSEELDAALEELEAEALLGEMDELPEAPADSVTTKPVKSKVKKQLEELKESLDDEL